MRPVAPTRRFGPGPTRGRGGSLALLVPLTLIWVAFSSGLRFGGDEVDFAASFVGSGLFLVAAPTTWVFRIPFIEVSRFTMLFLGAATSLPLWYLAGAWLAERSSTWVRWASRYVTVSALWGLLNLLVLAVADAAGA